MNEKMLLSEDKLITASIGIISLIFFSFIIGDMLGIVCLFSNHTLAKTLFGIFLFCPATFIFVVALLLMSYGVFHYLYDGRETAPEKGSKMILNSVVAIFFPGIFILVTDVIFLKVPFGIHLLFSYCILLLLLFGSSGLARSLFSYCILQFLLFGSSLVAIGSLVIPEEDKNTRFIAWFITLLEHIIPKEHHEEKLGDVQEEYNHSINKAINEGTPLWEVYRETLLGGLCLIGGSLWLKAHKFLSRWITRAK